MGTTIHDEINLMESVDIREEIPSYLKVVKLNESYLENIDKELSVKLTSCNYYNTNSFQINIDEKEFTFQEFEEKFNEDREGEKFVNIESLINFMNPYAVLWYPNVHRYTKSAIEFDGTIRISKKDDAVFDLKIIGGTYATINMNRENSIQFEKGEIDKETGENTFVLSDINIKNPLFLIRFVYNGCIIVSDGHTLTYNSLCLSEKHRNLILNYGIITKLENQKICIVNNGGINYVLPDNCIDDEDEIMVKPACTFTR